MNHEVLGSRMPMKVARLLEMDNCDVQISPCGAARPIARCRLERCPLVYLTGGNEQAQDDKAERTPSASTRLSNCKICNISTFLVPRLPLSICSDQNETRESSQTVSAKRSTKYCCILFGALAPPGAFRERDGWMGSLAKRRRSFPNRPQLNFQCGKVRLVYGSTKVSDRTVLDGGPARLYLHTYMVG